MGVQDLKWGTYDVLLVGSISASPRRARSGNNLQWRRSYCTTVWEKVPTKHTQKNKTTLANSHLPFQLLLGKRGADELRTVRSLRFDRLLVLAFELWFGTV